MKRNPSVLIGKSALIVLLGMLVSGIFPTEAFSQEKIPVYKIIGANRVPVYFGNQLERWVEYDPLFDDHIYILDIGEKGKLMKKSQFLFKGEKFYLENFQYYIDRKKLLLDGKQTIYAEDQSIEREFIYKLDMLQQQTHYFKDGKRSLFFSENDNQLNGGFKEWYPNGQLSFSGNYKNNLKDGAFESFDEAGNPDKKGVYNLGKLISGEPVVRDILYNAPEIPAQLFDGEEAFNEYLKTKTAGMSLVRIIAEGRFTDIHLVLTIDKTGHITKMEIPSDLNDAEKAIVNAAFNGLSGFKPAMVEGVSVRSILKQHLVLSNKGLQTNAQLEAQMAMLENNLLHDSIYLKVDEMPEFPGGQEALLKFIARTIKYPMEAAQKGIQGKSFVSFVVREDGKVINIAIAKSSHRFLDAEAIRVAQNMPRWIPGRQNGEAFKVAFTIPIHFVLE